MDIHADEQLRQHLEVTVAFKAQLVHDDGAWAVVMPGLPFAAEAADLAESVADLVENLRDYAAEWQDQLHAAPNHQGNESLVQLVKLSSDEQLAAWLAGVTPPFTSWIRPGGSESTARNDRRSSQAVEPLQPTPDHFLQPTGLPYSSVKDAERVPWAWTPDGWGRP